MGIGEDGYYSLRDILGYGCKYNIVLSDRGRGKSYGTKLFLMKQEGTFMCVYRQKPDMSSAIGSWIDPLVEQGYNAAAFEWEGSDEEGWQLLFNGTVKGYFRYLTAVNRIKQEMFPDNLNWVWWDEFIPLVYKKLGGVTSEGDALRTILKTIEHDTTHTRTEKGLKPLRVLMYANPFTWDNPLLSYFHINGLLGPGIHRAGPGVAWELLAPHEGDSQDAEAFLGDEVYKNMGFMDEAGFVEDIPKGARVMYQVRIEKNTYWIVRKDKLYIKRAPKILKGERCYGTLKGRQDYELSWEDTGIRIWMQKCAQAGTLRYADINVKFDFLSDLFGRK